MSPNNTRRKRGTRKELIRKWIEDLRSGNYDQMSGQLGQERPGVKPERCCLGVACDSHRHFMPTFTKKIESPSEFDYMVTYGNGEDTVLPRTLVRLLGFESASGDIWLPVFGNKWIGYDLASLNDDGLTFDQIADLIEAGFFGPEVRGRARADGTTNHHNAMAEAENAAAEDGRPWT